MRWLINYFQSCFCKHEWECLQKEIPVYNNLYEYYCKTPIKYKWIYRCKKCCCKK